MPSKETYKDLLIVGGALILGYAILKSQGIIKETPPTSSAVTPECPQGSKYTKGLFGDCAANYVLDPWENFVSGGTCKCLSSQ